MDAHPRSTASGKGSKIARLKAARMAAVQAVYQMGETGQGAESVVREFIAHRLGRPVDGENLVEPDKPLFSRIVTGVEGRRTDLDGLIEATLTERNRNKSPESASFVEPLIRSILLCGAAEILIHGEIDPPIIIADYLDVTHAFYEGGEARLVNGVLDSVRRAVQED